MNILYGVINGSDTNSYNLLLSVCIYMYIVNHLVCLMHGILYFRYAQECSICDNWLGRPDDQSMGVSLGTKLALSDFSTELYSYLLLHHCALYTCKPPQSWAGRIIFVSTLAYSACYCVYLHFPYPCCAVIGIALSCSVIFKTMWSFTKPSRG